VLTNLYLIASSACTVTTVKPHKEWKLNLYEILYMATLCWSWTWKKASIMYLIVTKLGRVTQRAANAYYYYMYYASTATRLPLRLQLKLQWHGLCIYLKYVGDSWSILNLTLKLAMQCCIRCWSSKVYSNFLPFIDHFLFHFSLIKWP